MTKNTKPKRKNKRTFSEALEDMGMTEKKRAKRALKLTEALTPDPSKLISPDGKIVLSDPSTPDGGLRDPFSEKADLLKTEWAFYGGELEPEVWLEAVKGYSTAQAKRIIEFEGYSGWKEKRLQFKNQALENFTARSVDTLVEFQDYIRKGAKLNLVRAMEMLSTPVKRIDPTTGKWLPGLTSMDLKNCMNTINEAHGTVLRAMGIHPKEEIGIKVIFDQLKTIQVNQLKEGTAGGAKTFDETGTEVVTPTDDPRMQTMTNEEMWAMIEVLRNQRKMDKEDET